jgi:hypothetical protein
LSSPIQVPVVAQNAVGLAGGAVTVPVSVGDITGWGLISVDLSVSFDSSKLTFTGIEQDGTLSEGWTAPYNVQYNENVGTILLGLANSSSMTGSGTFVELLFDINAGVTASSTVTINSVLLNEGRIPSTTTNGTVSIAHLKYGDVSADNAIGVNDATEILKYTVGLDSVFTVEEAIPSWYPRFLTQSEAHEIADVSNNGEIRAYDAALVLQRMFDIITEFPAESAAAPSALLASGFSYRLEGSSDTIRPGDAFKLLVHLDGNGSIYAGDLAFTYDPALFRLVDVSAPAAESARALVAKKTESGRVSLAVAGATPILGDRFVELTFVASPTFRKGSLGEVRVSRFDVNESRLEPSAYRFGLLAYQFRLLPNYPNPFNPETWIPFELDATSRVTVNIYGTNGQLVRRLDLGVRDAGEHVDKTSAAYWDGRNEQGEVVASGVYHYEIRTESASATRAMVIRK